MLSVSAEGQALYTPEQQAYIVKYAAGLLVAWTQDHIGNLISPDVGDGFDCVFHEQPGLFPDPEAEEAAGKQPLVWEAHSEVCSVLDTFLEELVKLAGFQNLEEAQQAIANGNGGTKYPVMATLDEAEDEGE